MKKRLINYLKNKQSFISKKELKDMNINELEFIKDNIELIKYMELK